MRPEHDRGDGTPGADRAGGVTGRVAVGLVVLGSVAVAVAVARRRRPQAVAAEVAPLPGRPRLVAVVGGQVRHGELTEPAETPLREGRQVLGRARDADVHLADLSVSPRHALVEADPAGRVVVRDLGAVNGVAVDGIPVAQAELHDGNRLQLGDVQLIYRSDPADDDGGRHGGELGEHIDP